MVLDVPGGDSAEGMAIVERANVMKAAGSYGATSEFLAPKPSFFNILYTHPKFGESAYLALQRGALVRRRLHCLRLTRVGTLCLLLCRRSAAVG